MHPSLAAAARNNAEWCAAMCRSHGMRTQLDADAWTSAVRTPRFYPDAVTLQSDADAARVLSRIDASPGCSIKDSFCALDLAPYGFSVLFDAQWIELTVDGGEPDPPEPGWHVVTETAELAAWERAWRSADDDPIGLFRAELLSDPAVKVLARREEGQVVAGAVLNQGPAGTVGLSNVFRWSRAYVETWAALPAVARQIFPAAKVIVGYESGDDLSDALGHGFAAVGPLRVWVNA